MQTNGVTKLLQERAMQCGSGLADLNLVACNRRPHLRFYFWHQPLDWSELWLVEDELFSCFCSGILHDHGRGASKIHNSTCRRLGITPKAR